MSKDTVVNNVYRKIKEISGRSTNPRPRIQVQMIAEEMVMPMDTLLYSLKELKELRLINTTGFHITDVKLTLLGSTVTR